MGLCDIGAVYEVGGVVFFLGIAVLVCLSSVVLVVVVLCCAVLVVVIVMYGRVRETVKGAVCSTQFI